MLEEHRDEKMRERIVRSLSSSLCATAPRRCNRENVMRRAAILLIAVSVALAAAIPAAGQTRRFVSTVAQLQGALVAVNAGTGGDSIILAPGNYALTSTLPTIDQDVTIQGDLNNMTLIDGGSLDWIFNIRAKNPVIQNLTLQGARYAILYQGSGVFSATGLTITATTTAAFSPGDSGGATFFTNSTIAVNVAHGIEISCAELHMTNVTVTDNGIGVYFDFPCGEQMKIANSLIVRNAHDCGGGGNFVPVGDASFDSDGSCVAMGFVPPGFRTVNLSSLALGGLAANGGPTMTEAISGTSVAKDAGDNTPGICPAIDQRGFLRNDGMCDIGAYEFGAAPPIINNTSTGTNVSVSPAPGVTLTFSNVIVAGNTTASTGGPLPPSGFQVDGVVYDIVTTATFNGTVKVCLPYNPQVDPVPTVSHSVSGIWQPQVTTPDLANHLACATVSSLSPFAVLYPLEISGQLQQLQVLINGFNLRKPVDKKFDHRLDKARDAFAEHDQKKFCKELAHFIDDVQRQSGRTLEASEANLVLAYASLIAGEAGC